MRIRAVLLLFFIIIQFNMMAGKPFTDRELEIIRNGDKDTPFRVLQVTDRVDSLILRMESEDVVTDSIVSDNDLQLLIERIILTMNVSQGVGIAAPQVGVLKNLFVFTRLDLPGEPLQVAINPSIVEVPDDTICFERDGCLSIPDISGNSLRYPWVRVEYWDEKGVFHSEILRGYSRADGDFTAVVFQHEFDHLRGILFTDKMCDGIKTGLDVEDSPGTLE